MSEFHKPYDPQTSKSDPEIMRKLNKQLDNSDPRSPIDKILTSVMKIIPGGSRNASTYNGGYYVAGEHKWKDHTKK